METECFTYNRKPSFEENQEFRKTTTYRKMKKACLRKARYRCKSCGELIYNIHVHHIWALSTIRGWRERSNRYNLVCLCIRCHAVLHWTNNHHKISPYNRLTAKERRNCKQCLEESNLIPERTTL